MATASGESLGGPMLKSEDGRAVRNLLYAFEGCFDTTWCGLFASTAIRERAI
jgi:hypothetical protein